MAPGINADKWQATSLRSTFGKQCKSNLKTAPACGFGSAVRSNCSKQYVSPDVDRANCKAMGGNNSQGAIYKVQETLGKQCLSTWHSAPVSGFGTAKRPSMAEKSAAPGPGAYKLKATIGGQFDSTKETAPSMRFTTANRDAAEKIFVSAEHEKAGYGRESPGPSAYNLSGGLGKQQLSDHETLPAWKMGGEKRFQYDFVKRAETSPGPGQYKPPNTVGPQVMSTKKTQPVIGFGHGTRDQTKKMFISVDHEKSNYGECSPGPTTANPSKGIGAQQLSTNANQPAWGFGSGKRLAGYVTDTPGPGEYYA
ncbi:hypothetical protein WJX72_007931 [[Myrmecia] bisecta]|uniref:Flagellar associated protein n=1 Tax=[Myrmecia] bisecta TaxID=41462 RepID=A0AAW1R839_9CHLO